MNTLQRHSTLYFTRYPIRHEGLSWTDPDSMAQWMCPGNIRSATAKLDVRVGGKLHIVMKGDDIDYEHTGEYRVVQPPSKLAFTWISKGTDSKHPEKSGFSDLRDWAGTTLRFEIAALDAKHSQLTFTHAGLAPLECFGVAVWRSVSRGDS